MSYNLKTIKEEFKASGIFYTTTALAEYVKSFVDVTFDEVYDPTCGDGSLLSVYGDSVHKYGQEINDSQLLVAKNKLVNFTGVCGDTLTDPAFTGKRFKCIVANPPFSIKWQPPSIGDFKQDARFSDAPAIPPKSKADYAFILHVLHYLHDDGVAVVLSFPGVLYRGNSEGIIRQWLVEQNLIDKIIRVPAKSFIDTTIETVIIVFRKNKQTTNIEFVDSENNKNTVVNIDTIKANGYSLSINQYISYAAVKPLFDCAAAQSNARIEMLNRVESDIRADKMVCDIEGWGNHNEYLDALQKLIEKHKLGMA